MESGRSIDGKKCWFLCKRCTEFLKNRFTFFVVRRKSGKLVDWRLSFP